METMAVSDRELDERGLDAQVALKIMGWRWYNPPGYCSAFVSPDAEVRHREYLSDKPTNKQQVGLSSSTIPRYSSSTPDGLYACRQMEEKIKEMGLQLQYAKALCEQVNEIDMAYIYSELFAIAHASPKERVLAALRVVEER